MANYLAPEDDPVNFLPARVNPNLAAQGRRYNLAERQQTSPLMQAGNVQFAKEIASMGNRGAVPDLINRGLIANTVGLPVDLLNTTLQFLGLGSEQPLGGSDSIRRALEFYGLSSETQRPMLETLTSLTPPKAVMGAARVAGQGAEALGRAAAPVAGQALENYMVRTGGILPMDTWHGTPHRFPPTKNNPLGEFDASKIGTGEGGQAYGVGAGYLAQDKALASNYRQITAHGFGLPEGIERSIATLLSSAKGDGEKVVREGFKKVLPPAELESAILVAKKAIADRSNLYKVDLPDEQIAKMLDLNKPLNQQHPSVIKALEAEKFNLKNHGEYTGEDIVHALRQNYFQPAKMSERLSELGITGFKYLDQNSIDVGKGTSNFVVFDPKHMNIIGRE